MTTVATALHELGIKEWVMRGEPTDSASFGTMFSKVIGADANGSAIESQKDSDLGVTWTQVKAKQDELIAGEPMRLLRIERDRKLAETDFYALGDVTMADNMKTYRQALRDLPASATPKLKADGTLDESSFTWPTKP
jgi:hypothetical protein